jgi:antitoxin component YwqK of YwqJK toxin-antitoxin module
MNNKIKNGPYEEYYGHKTLRERGFYKDGEKDGLWEWYYPEGHLWKKCSYQKGEKNGLYGSWHFS